MKSIANFFKGLFGKKTRKPKPEDNKKIIATKKPSVKPKKEYTRYRWFEGLTKGGRRRSKRRHGKGKIEYKRRKKQRRDNKRKGGA